MANDSFVMAFVSNESTQLPFDYSNVTLEKDVAYWLFKRKDVKSSPNMTVLPVMALLSFIVCVFLKIYKWYKENERMRTRGDVEFGDESEVNYGIIKAGDKEFCNVEIRSDTTSMYDTVTSFRHLGNGHIGGAAGAYNYHDSVTSYKSLLMQRLDGTQYDSVKSYKAFLRQVTQNKDLAVEVKLLENYPYKSKSAEHCVLEEESSGISELAKPFPVCNMKIPLESKKKTRHRRASGDPIGAMRKRSASNPIYHTKRDGATSLPSIRRCSFSSDSSNEDETYAALEADRKKLVENRKRMARSCSGGRLAKTSMTHTNLGDVSSDAPHRYTRRRHFSADSARQPRKPLSSFIRAELKDLRESISETDPTKPEESVLLRKQEDSSSENADSAPTSCSMSVSSDAIESESEDESTQQVTQMSAASDDHTVSCEGVFESCNELTSSTEHLCDQLNKCFEESAAEGSQSLENLEDKERKISPFVFPHGSSTSSSNYDGNSSQVQTTTSAPAIDIDVHSTSASTNIQETNVIQVNTQNNIYTQNLSSILGSNSLSPQPMGSSSNMCLSQNGATEKLEIDCSLAGTNANKVENENESTDCSNPRRVKRFHVTFVSSDVSSPNSE